MKMRFCLIGYPLGHTLSDKIHSFLFSAFGRKATYEIKEIEPGCLETEIKNLRNYSGFNVTAPYKTDIIRYLDDIDEVVKRCNSVNTVLNKNKKLIGYNTDMLGFEYSLKFHNIDLSEKNLKICLIGFGGVGRTVLCYFLNNNINNITILVRDICEKKINLIKSYNKNILVKDLDEINKDNINYNLLINATPVGTFPNTEESILSETFLKNIDCIYDLVYNPSVTELMKRGLKSGCKVFNGENMLMWQAIWTQKIWFS